MAEVWLWKKCPSGGGFSAAELVLRRAWNCSMDFESRRVPERTLKADFLEMVPSCAASWNVSRRCLRLGCNKWNSPWVQQLGDHFQHEHGTASAFAVDPSGNMLGASEL